MSTLDLIQQPEPAIRDWARSSPIEPTVSVSVTKSVNADRSRIFQALTLPEYIEAWLSIPDALPGGAVVSMASNSCAITYSRLDGKQVRFLCAYTILRRSKVQFTWKRDDFIELTPSLVKVRLNGDFGRTTVHLTHLVSREVDDVWYRDLWEGSLQKLACLF